MSFKNHLEDNLKTASLSLNKAWTGTAQNAGWPDEMHSQVSVNASPSGVSFNYPDAISDEVFDTEYGSVGKKPKAAMRVLEQIGKKEIKKAVYKAFSQDLSDAGLF
jgi:hypothetical protein